MFFTQYKVLTTHSSTDPTTHPSISIHPTPPSIHPSTNPTITNLSIQPYTLIREQYHYTSTPVYPPTPQSSHLINKYIGASTIYRALGINTRTKSP